MIIPIKTYAYNQRVPEFRSPRMEIILIGFDLFGVRRPTEPLLSRRLALKLGSIWTIRSSEFSRTIAITATTVTAYQANFSLFPVSVPVPLDVIVSLVYYVFPIFRALRNYSFTCNMVWQKQKRTDNNGDLFWWSCSSKFLPCLRFGWKGKLATRSLLNSLVTSYIRVVLVPLLVVATVSNSYRRSDLSLCHCGWREILRFSSNWNLTFTYI